MTHLFCYITNPFFVAISGIIATSFSNDINSVQLLIALGKWTVQIARYYNACVNNFLKAINNSLCGKSKTFHL